MDERTSCCHGAGGYCDRCDLLVDLPGLHVIGVEHDTADRVVVTVGSSGPRRRWRRRGMARGRGRRTNPPVVFPQDDDAHPCG